MPRDPLTPQLGSELALLVYENLDFTWRAMRPRLVSAGSGIRGFTPFRFSVEPVDTLAVRGLPAVLNCSAASNALVRVEWKKDGTFLNLVADDRKRQLADGSLLISTVVHSKHNKPDEGVYQCVATIDNLGTISSRTARLTVA
ncbi:hypothetical protein cypCar_00027127, partial [Cyprinus carpio]